MVWAPVVGTLRFFHELYLVFPLHYLSFLQVQLVNVIEKVRPSFFGVLQL